MKTSVPQWIFSIVFAAIYFGLLTPALADTADLLKKVQPATMIIYVYDANGKPTKQGSGFLFKSEGHLITNYHVLGEAGMAKARMGDGREYNVKAVVAEAKADDLIEAIIDIPSGGARPLMPAAARAKVGDQVLVIGSPLGVEKAISQGAVAVIGELPGYGRAIVHSAHSFPGSSGSPLVNMQGEVVGVESAGIPGRPDVNFALPLERLMTGLKPVYRQLKTPGAATSTALSGTSAKTGDQDDAFKQDRKLADSGDPAAQVRLAVRYESGNGVPKNCFEALAQYRRAAEQGSVQGQFNVGRMYYDGKCMGRNLGEAVRWLQKAADRGYSDAQALMGNLCFNGEGVPRDRVHACMWVMLAAAQRNQEAQKLLRFMSAELTKDEFTTAQEKARAWKPSR